MSSTRWTLIVALTACGPQASSSEAGGGSAGSTSNPPATTSTTETGSEATTSGSTSTGLPEIDCPALDEDTCAAEPACEPLVVLPEIVPGCAGEGIYLGCQAADCPGSPCWVCGPDAPEQQAWAANCGCLVEPWAACDDAPEAPARPQVCECINSGDCPERWQFCEEGSCVGCSDWFQSCTCLEIGCAPGRCCGWEAYCLNGDPDPDGNCSPR